MDLNLRVSCAVANDTGVILLRIQWDPLMLVEMTLPSQEAAENVRDLLVTHINQAIELARPRRMGLIVPGPNGQLPSL